MNLNLFLVNSEGVQNDEIVGKVAKQIRELAYKAEDVIDGFILCAAEQSTMNVVWKTIRFSFKFHGVGKKIKGLNKEITKILNNRNTYSTEGAKAGVGLPATNEALDRYRRDVKENDVVGFSGDLATLVRQLTEGNSRFDVISIIGMGGLGKTTLAKKIYNNDFVKSHFNCCVWVSVSQDFRAKDLLLKILTSHMLIWDRNELTTRVTSMNNEELQLKYLIEQVFKYLQGNKYLIVMDDVCVG